MSVYSGPNTTQSGLIFHIDPSNTRCYPGAGTTLFDLSGSGSDGTLTSGASVIANKSLKILNFDGNDDYISTLGTFNITGDLTLSFWFKGTNTLDNESRSLLASSNTTGSQAPFVVTYGYQSNGGKLQFWNSVSGPSISGSTIVMDGLWHHASVRRGSFGSQLFVDGRLDGSSATTTGQSGATAGLAIGRIGKYNGYYADAQMDDVRVYNRALSYPEIINNYNAIRGRFGI